jgi:hypothetical protein
MRPIQEEPSCAVKPRGRQIPAASLPLYQCPPKPELLVNVSLETSFTLSMCRNSAGIFSEMSMNHPLPNPDNIHKEMTFFC